MKSLDEETERSHQKIGQYEVIGQWKGGHPTMGQNEVYIESGAERSHHEM